MKNIFVLICLWSLNQTNRIAREHNQMQLWSIQLFRQFKKMFWLWTFQNPTANKLFVLKGVQGPRAQGSFSRPGNHWKTWTMCNVHPVFHHKEMLSSHLHHHHENLKKKCSFDQTFVWIRNGCKYFLQKKVSNSKWL